MHNHVGDNLNKNHQKSLIICLSILCPVWYRLGKKWTWVYLLSGPGVVFRIYVCKGMCIVYHRPPLCSTTYAGALKFYGFPQRFSGANLLFILRSRWGWIQRSLRKEIAWRRCIPRCRDAMDIGRDTFIEKGRVLMDTRYRWSADVITCPWNGKIELLQNSYLSISFLTNHVWQGLYSSFGFNPFNLYRQYKTVMFKHYHIIRFYMQQFI